MRGPLGAARGTYPSNDWNAQMGNRGSGIIRHNRKCRDVVELYSHGNRGSGIINSVNYLPGATMVAAEGTIESFRSGLALIGFTCDLLRERFRAIDEA